MNTAFGIFRNSRVASASVRRVERAIPGARVRVFASPAAAGELTNLPADDTETPGIGPAVGGVVGSAAGAAVASLLVPPVGVPAVIALAAGALLGFGGGAVVGERLEEQLSFGVARDELFIYEDALRQGRALVVVQVEDDDAADAARELLAADGAESIDAAREEWWLGLRDAEGEAYQADGRDFASDEPFFRKGFEAALAAEPGEPPNMAVVRCLEERAADPVAVAAFERGWQRAGVYREQVMILTVTRPKAVEEAIHRS
jgi:outer membrane lipoprotein SlyB